jgi:sugar/nucleoside kinase (ribokinase family)
VIVVIGAVAAGGIEGEVVPAGLAAQIARSAVAAGATVQLVTRLGEDAAGDAVLLAMAALGIGHVATLRDAALATAIRAAASEPMDPVPSDSDDAAGAPATIVPVEAVLDGFPIEPTLEAADVGLALRYLDGYRVIVVVHPPDDDIVREVVAATAWASAHLVVVLRPGAAAPTALPVESVLLEADDDADAVAALLGRYVAAVDDGAAPVAAFQATIGAPA